MNNSILKIFLVLSVISISIFLSIPTFLNSYNNDNWYLNNKINLGLDLQGGSHILLEVKNQILLEEEINNIIDFFRQFIRNEKIKIDFLEKNEETISIKINNTLDKDKLVNFKNKNFPDINYNYTNNILNFELSDTYKKRLFESSINQSLEIVRKRIDESGTKEPLIQRQGIDRILLQLPGIKDH